MFMFYKNIECISFFDFFKIQKYLLQIYLEII